MARPRSDKVRVKTVRNRTKTGTVYVYERKVRYNPENGYDDVLESRLVGKILPGSEEIIPTRVYRRSNGGGDGGLPPVPPSDGRQENAGDGSGSVLAVRRHAGLTALLEFAGKATGIDEDVGYATEESRDGETLPPKVAALLRDRVISLARFWTGSSGMSVNHVSDWQLTHDLPAVLSESVCHELCEETGRNEQLIQAYFRRRASREQKGECIAIDSTAHSVYSVYENHPEARFSKGNDKEGKGFPVVKHIVLYSLGSGQPLAFSQQPGDVPDVVSLVNALKELKSLRTKKPMAVADNGFWSMSAGAELFRNHIKFLVRVAASDGAWFRERMDEMLPLLDSPEAILEAAPGIRGISRPAVLELNGKWAYKTANHEKGESYIIRRRVYLHLFLNVQKRADEENNLGRSAMLLKHDLEQGRLDELNDAARRQALSLFTLGRKGRNGTYSVTFNEEAYHERLKRCGVFMLMTSSAKLTAEDALLTYRKRNRLESYFESERRCCDASRERVWDRDTARGRMFLQMTAMGYTEFFYTKIREIKAEVQKRLDALDNPKSEEGKLLTSLRSWLANKSLQEILTWYDCIDVIRFTDRNTDRYDKLVKKITTETLRRDELFLSLLGMKTGENTT